MALAPTWMLEGAITLIKEIKTPTGTEKHYEDEHGTRAVIFVPDKQKKEE